jgi:hypothetical protein
MDRRDLALVSDIIQPAAMPAIMAGTATPKSVCT